MQASRLQSPIRVEQAGITGSPLACRAASLVTASLATLAVHLPLHAAPVFNHRVAPGAIAEECTRLPAGKTMRYAFKSTRPVDFNIHFHVGQQVEYPVKRESVADVEDAFQAATAQDYCLMWTNRTGETVFVEGRLR